MLGVGNLEGLNLEPRWLLFPAYILKVAQLLVINKIEHGSLGSIKYYRSKNLAVGDPANPSGFPHVCNMPEHAELMKVHFKKLKPQKMS